MINEQLFGRVIDTLLENNDAVVVAVANGDDSRVFMRGPDSSLIPLIDSIEATYIKDVVKDYEAADYDKIQALEQLLQYWANAKNQTNNTINTVESLAKEIEEALGNIDWEALEDDSEQEDEQKN